MSEVETPAAFLESAEIDAFLQRNADYYKAKWAAAVEKSGSLERLAKKQNQISWNWAAFFFSYAWLFYRKLYLLGAVALTIAVAVVAAEQITGEKLSGILIGIALGVGLYGNTWYLARAYRRVVEVRRTTEDPAARIALLAATGGTNPSLALAAPAAAIAIAVALPMVTNGTNFPSVADLANVDSSSETTVSESFQEISAWWDADGERVGILVTPQQMGLYVSGDMDISDRGLITSTPDAFKPFRIVQEDVANDSWSFELIDSPGRIWTVSKRWDENRERFTLALFPPGGQGLSLGFVRRFTPDEISQLTSAASSAAATSATIAGVYRYLEPDHSGTITVSAAPEDTFDVIVQTLNTASGSQCRFGMARATRVEHTSAMISWNDGDSCSVLLDFENNEAHMDGRNDGCQKYCGDDAQFLGSYEAVRR